MDNTLISQFSNAVANSKLLSQKPDNATLLKLYALYKQATEGDINVPEPENPFDFVAKAKHQAWQDLKGMTKDASMSQYIQLVETLQKNS
ncbi:MAG: acyl-CoA-binding protein [Lacibacter sp.]